MAMKSGIVYNQSLNEFHTPFSDGVYLDDLADFAALVAEKERAKIVTLLKGSLDEDDDADLWYLAIKCMIEKIEKVDAA
jgi:hypothetical protein